MAQIPQQILRQLYTKSSLKNLENALEFQLKNRLSDAQLLKVLKVEINGLSVDLDQVLIESKDSLKYKASEVSPEIPLDFPLRQVLKIQVQGLSFGEGTQKISLEFDSQPLGNLQLHIEDQVPPLETIEEDPDRIPRDLENDYSSSAIQKRQAFMQRKTQKKFPHLQAYSFDAEGVAGNCENFIGVAQVPIGLAGPLKVQGEHAQGDFLIPLATSEGTLVASYNRGMKAINRSGGVTCTVLEDQMQRSPGFTFKDARAARDFQDWCKQEFNTLAKTAEATSNHARLLNIEYYLSNQYAFLRLNFHTGDAAGQNMVTKATLAACNWIIEHYPRSKEIQHFYLDSNLTTDKKPSQINTLHTRGKRVVAECTFSPKVLEEELRVSSEQLYAHSQMANIGAQLAGSVSNGLHSSNGLTALFIATGQDIANISESCSSILHIDINDRKELYVSITLPSLIVATVGGGTGLATQKECLEMMDCYGTGKVLKLAEIMAGVVLAGELSLGSAISAADWVSSHESLGRNRI